MAKKYSANEMKQIDAFATGVFTSMGVHRDDGVVVSRIKQSFDVAELMLAESKKRAALEEDKQNA